jgi:hypothetical protein
MAAEAACWENASCREAIFDAVSAGRVEVEDVEAALTAGFPSDAVDNRGNTLLHKVVANTEYHTLVPRLLENHWDPNARNDSGKTPVCTACVVGKLSLVQTLVQAGGRLDCADNQGWPALFYALFALNCGQSQEAVKTLLEWLVTRVEVDWFHIGDEGITALYTAGPPHLDKWRIAIILRAQALQRQRESRWSPLRAAFVGAVAGCAV